MFIYIRLDTLSLIGRNVSEKPESIKNSPVRVLTNSKKDFIVNIYSSSDAVLAIMIQPSMPVHCVLISCHAKISRSQNIIQYFAANIVMYRSTHKR